MNNDHSEEDCTCLLSDSQHVICLFLLHTNILPVVVRTSWFHHCTYSISLHVNCVLYIICDFTWCTCYLCPGVCLFFLVSSPLWFLLLLIPFRIFTYYCFHQRKWNFLHNCKAVRLFLSSPLASIYDIVYMVLDWELTHTKSFLFPATGIHRCSIDLICRERLVWVAVVVSMQSCLLLAWLFCISLSPLDIKK